MRRIPLAIWLFALPFVLLGLASASFAGWQVARHLQSLSWEAVPATLEEIGQQSHDHARSGSIAWQTTQRTAGRYRYEMNGITYTGDRLSFSAAFDNGFDDWWEQVRAHVGEPGNTFEAWADPGNPADSVALRAVRWSEVGLLLLAALVCCGSGLALLTAAARKRNAAPSRVSWPLVAATWLIAPFGLVLAWLLWMDNMPGWAALGLLPAALATNGSLAGLRQRIRDRASRGKHTGKTEGKD